MIVVTGATGTVGGLVVEALAEQDVPVRAAVRDPDAAAAALPDECTPVRFDFDRPETYARAFQGVARLFLVRPPAISDVRARIFPAVDAAIAAGVKQIVFLSLLGAERNPLVPHRAIEQHVQAAAVDHVLLRPSFFMQNLSTVHRADIRDHDEIYVPAGRGRTSFIDARDIADVAVHVLTVPAQHVASAYALTGGEALTYDEVASVLTDVLGRAITYPAPSIPAFVHRMRGLGHPWAFVAVMSAIYTTCRLNLAGQVTTDVEHLLGRPPRTFRTFAEDYRAVWIEGDRA